MDKKIAIHTMELWLANLPVTPGRVQHGTRPVVIVSNDVANNFSPIVTAVPLTSNRNGNSRCFFACKEEILSNVISTEQVPNFCSEPESPEDM